MSLSNLHGLYAGELGSTVLGGMFQQRVNTGTECQGEPSSGEVYARFHSIVGQNPGATFTTRQLKTAIDTITSFGSSIASLTGGLKLYAQKHAMAGARASGSTHKQYKFLAGVVVPRMLQAAHQGDANLSYEVLPTWDGTNDPLVITDNVALPSGLTDALRYTIGPVTIGGVTIAQVRGVDIDFGINAVREGSDSDVWPTLVTIREILPKITIRGVNVDWLKAANIPLLGKAAAHADTKIYFRKRAVGGTYVADATAEHVKVTACGLAYVDQAFDANANNPGEVNLVLDTRFDGTNNPIVVNTASVIS